MTRATIGKGKPPTIGPYELGFKYCKECGEWAHKDDEQKVRLTFNGQLRHRDCGLPMRGTPHGSAFRKKLHEKTGIKWL